MTVVKFSAEGRISNVSELFDRYTGFGGSRDDMMMGGETERIYHDKNDPARIMSPGEQKSFCEKIITANITDKDGGPRKIGFSLETVSHVIEEQTQAFPHKKAGRIIDQEREIASVMTHISEELNLRQCVFTANPFLTHADCKANPVHTPRARTDMLVAALEKYLGHDATSYTFLTSPVHVSLSYSDPSQLWDMARRNCYLTPWQYLAGDNGSNFMERAAEPLHHQFTRRANNALNVRGGIPEYFYNSRDGQDYIKGHLNAVLNNPMVIMFGEDGVEFTPEDGKFITPRQIINETGSVSLANFDLAESTLWPDGKICNIRDGEDNVIGKRYEVRMWDTGPHQFASMVLSSQALMMDQQGGEECDMLLADFGFGQDTSKAEPYLRQAMHDSLWHGGRFLDIPFGKPSPSTSKQRSLQDFQVELFPIIRRTWERNDPSQLPRLEPLRNICETGMSDARVIAETYPTLEAVGHFMQNAPLDIYNRDTPTSYYIMREAGELPDLEQDDLSSKSQISYYLQNHL